MSQLSWIYSSYICRVSLKKPARLGDKTSGGMLGSDWSCGWGSKMLFLRWLTSLAYRDTSFRVRFRRISCFCNCTRAVIRRIACTKRWSFRCVIINRTIFSKPALFWVNHATTGSAAVRWWRAARRSFQLTDALDGLSRLTFRCKPLCS